MFNKLSVVKQWFLKNRWRVLLVIVITVIFFVIWIYNVNHVNDLILENHRLEMKSKDLISQNEDSRRLLSHLKSPDRIIRIAESRGLILNEEAPIVLLDTIVKIKQGGK